MDMKRLEDAAHKALEIMDSDQRQALSEKIANHQLVLEVLKGFFQQDLLRTDSTVDDLITVLIKTLEEE